MVRLVEMRFIKCGCSEFENEEKLEALSRRSNRIRPNTVRTKHRCALKQKVKARNNHRIECFQIVPVERVS